MADLCHPGPDAGAAHGDRDRGGLVAVEGLVEVQHQQVLWYRHRVQLAVRLGPARPTLGACAVVGAANCLSDGLGNPVLFKVYPGSGGAESDVLYAV